MSVRSRAAGCARTKGADDPLRAPPTTVERNRVGAGGWEMALRNPLPALAPYIGRYWGFDEDVGRPLVRRGFARADVTLIINLGPPLVVVTAPKCTDRVQTRQVSYVTGLRDTYVDIHHDGESRGVEVCLTPLGARALLGAPAGELTQRAIGLDELLGGDAARLCDQLHEASRWEQRFALLDAYFSIRAASAASPDATIASAWRRISDPCGGGRIASLVAEAGCSHRHFVARFRDEVGLAPKTAARVLRFEAVRRALERRDPAAWAELASRCGYSDQAHLIRDFQAFTGFSPTELLARRLPGRGGFEADPTVPCLRHRSISFKTRGPGESSVTASTAGLY